jgi:hypothetical protein
MTICKGTSYNARFHVQTDQGSFFKKYISIKNYIYI